MQPDTPTPADNAPAHFLPRKTELEALASALPIRGVESGNNRVFNIWGEDGVGKTSFVSEFRESKLMSKAKVLWIQPTRDGALDSIPEFIRACSKTIRYPSAPSKEKKISEHLESVERGKVNPIVSDDTLLITRTSIAKQKKPYINQAAASSVGRTEIVRDDVEINVGLGESKANNHAEAFLDALPLQSLGTDLTIIYIEKLQNLSVSIIDWLRDYVFPAATRGAYRRSVIFLIESLDPLKLAYPNETWGDWSNLTEDFRLYPLCNDDCYQLAIASGLKPDTAHILQYETYGYPQALHKTIDALKSLDRRPAANFLDTLPEADQLKVATLSLPEVLHPDELDILLGTKQGTTLFKWFHQLPNNQTQHSPSGKTIALSPALRCEALSRFASHPELAASAKKWAPMGRLSRNVPSRADRAKLFLLSGLLWINDELCQNLFGNQSEKILPFVKEQSALFNRDKERYRISERIRADLQKAARHLDHPGLTVVLQKATKLWEEQKAQLLEQIETLEAKLEDSQNEINALARRQSETLTQIRIHKRDTDEPDPSEHQTHLLPKWLRFGKNDDSNPNSPASLKALAHDLNQKIHEHELASDELRNQLALARKDLHYPFV